MLLENPHIFQQESNLEKHWDAPPAAEENLLIPRIRSKPCSNRLDIVLIGAFSASRDSNISFATNIVSIRVFLLIWKYRTWIKTVLQPAALSPYRFWRLMSTWLLGIFRVFITQLHSHEYHCFISSWERRQLTLENTGVATGSYTIFEDKFPQAPPGERVSFAKLASWNDNHDNWEKTDGVVSFRQHIPMCCVSWPIKMFPILRDTSQTIFYGKEQTSFIGFRARSTQSPTTNKCNAVCFHKW